MGNTEEKPRILSPSAAFHDCKMEQKECKDNCTILYRIASHDLHKFAILQEVFGACNVIKLIQDLPSDQRVEAIDSMVYEASARLQEPALGCAGIIQQLQRQISDLESQITSTQARIQKIHCQQAELVAFIPGFNSTSEDDD
jgi:ATP-dependent protease Clp ATPase subunit